MKYRNGPGVGLLAGDVAGIHRKPVPDWHCSTMWGCELCGEGISEGSFCLACEVEIRDRQTDIELNSGATVLGVSVWP